MGKQKISGDPVASFEQELWVWFFLGVLRQRWKDRKRPLGRGNNTNESLGTDLDNV